MDLLVTLEEARTHLRVDGIDHDEDIGLKLAAATEIVIDYIKQPDHGWDAETAPFMIKAAILLMLAVLFEDREGAGIPSGVKSILYRFRDPAIA